MKSLILLFIFSMMCTGSYCAQEKRVLIIDTVDQIPGIRNPSWNAENNFHVEVSNPSWPFFEDTIIWGGEPAIYKVVVPIRLSEPNSTLRLFLDDKWGYLEIKDLYVSKCDTIHINRIRRFHNCMQDSVRTAKQWFKKQENADLVFIRTDFSTRLEPNKKCKPSWTDTYAITINGIEYVVPLRTVWDSNQGMAGHGYKQKRPEERLAKGKIVDYFHFDSRIKKSLLRAELSLK